MPTSVPHQSSTPDVLAVGHDTTGRPTTGLSDELPQASEQPGFVSRWVELLREAHQARVPF
jgi:hypothetical protein